jgi:anti-sigma regulatory factor (Ser/Thr protein kinase)
MNASPPGLSRRQRRQPVRSSWLPRPAGRWRPGSHGRVLHELEAQLPAAPVSEGTARHLAGQLLSDWGLTALADDVLLVTSELAANAISESQRICGSAIALRLARTPGGLLVALADPAGAGRLPAQLRLAAPGPVPRGSDRDELDELDQVDQLAEHGRGLVLAAAVAERLGWYRTGRWTVVWAEFSATDDAEYSTADAA